MPNPKDLRDLHRQLVSDGIIDMGYKQFESIATAKGKEGVQNRQDLYNIAREGGYHTGSYKDFANAYFVPVSPQKKEQMKQQARQATGRQAPAQPQKPAATPQGQKPKPVQQPTPNKPDSVVQQYMPTVDPTAGNGQISRVRPQQGTGVLKTDAQIMADDTLSAGDKATLINDNRRRRGQQEHSFGRPSYEEAALNAGVNLDNTNPVEGFTESVEAGFQPDHFFTDSEGNVLDYKPDNYVNKSPVTQYNDRIKEIADEINYYNTKQDQGNGGTTIIEDAINDAYAKFVKADQRRMYNGMGGFARSLAAGETQGVSEAIERGSLREKYAGLYAVAEAAYNSFPDEVKQKYGEDAVYSAIYQATLSAMQENARPKNYGEYLAQKLVSTVPAILYKAAVRANAGGRTTLSDIADMETAKYEQELDKQGFVGQVKQGIGTGVSFVADPTMYIPFGGGAGNLVGRGIASVAAKQAVGRGLEAGAVRLASKAAGSKIISRGLVHGVSGGVQMAAYEEALGLANMANGSGQNFWDVTGEALETGAIMVPLGFVSQGARVVKGRTATAIADKGLSRGAQWAANTGAKLGINTTAFIAEAGIFASPDLIKMAVNGTYTNEQARDVVNHSIASLAGIKVAGAFNPTHIEQTMQQVRSVVKGTMGTELALDRHDSEALERLGYPKIQGDNIMSLFMPLGERPEAREGGGYFSMYSQIVLDERVPWSTRAKLIYVATGKLPETGVRPNSVRKTTDENGRIVVTTLQGNNPISQRFFDKKHSASAESYLRKVSHDVERMNFEGTKQDIMSEHLGGMFKSKLVNDALSKDPKSRTPEEQKLVDDYNHEVWVVEDLMLGVDKWRVENEDKLPDPEKALKKPEWERTEAEKQAVQRYGERLNKTLHDILRDNYADMAADLAWRDATDAADEMSNKQDGNLYQCQIRGEEGVWYTVVDFDGTIEQGETGMDVTPGPNGDKMVVRNMATGETKMVTLSELTTLSTDRYIEVRNALSESMYNNYTEELIRNRRKALMYGKQPLNAEEGERLTLAADDVDPTTGLRPEYTVINKDGMSGTYIVEDAQGNRKLINGHDILQKITDTEQQIPTQIAPQVPPTGPQTPPPAAPAQEPPMQPQGEAPAMPEQGEVFKLKVGDEFKDAEVIGKDDTGIIVRYEDGGMFRTEHLTSEELAPRLEQQEAPAAPVTQPAQGEGAPAAPVAEDGIPRDESGNRLYHKLYQKAVEEHLKGRGLDDEDIMAIADSNINKAQKDLDDANTALAEARASGNEDGIVMAKAIKKDAQERLDWWNKFKEGYGKEEVESRPIQGMEGHTEQDVKDSVRLFIEEQLANAGVEGVTIKGMALHGSRMRGDARPDSDLDVVVEYEGDISEDGLFNLLNEEPMYLEGIKVDINPITKGKSGTLEQYMERSREYDEERRNQPPVVEGGGEPPVQEADIPQGTPRNTNIPNAPIPEKVPDATTPEEKSAQAAANAKRYNEAEKLDGYRVQITLPNGEKVTARYKVVPHDVVVPSHDPFNGYRSTPGYAEDAEGRNVNDRDYSDPNYQFENEKKAQNYDGRAITEPPVVNTGENYGGSVLGGNDRTMAGQLAATRGTDVAYLDALDYNIEQYGISRRALREFMERNPHARLVLEVEGEMPMTTESMAKFNQSGMKSSGTAQSTNKVRRLLTDKEIRDLAGIIGTSTDKTFGDLSRSPSVAAGILRVLKEAGIILENEQAEFLRANGSLSRKGEALLQEIVRASILDERGIKALETASDDYNLTDIEQRIDQITPSLIRNAALGEMSLRNEISRAIEHIRQTYESWANGKKRGLKGSKKDALVAAANATGGSIEFDTKTEEEIASEQTSRILSLVFGTFSKEDAIKFFNEYEKMAKTAQRSQEGFGGLFGETIGRVDILKELAKKYGLKVKEDNGPEQGQGQPGETETPGGNGGGNQGNGRPSGTSGTGGEGGTGTGRGTGEGRPAEGEGPVTPPRPGAPQGGGEPPKGEGEPPKPEEPGKPAGEPAGAPAASEPHQLTVDEIKGLNLSQTIEENAIDYVNGDRGPRARIAYAVALRAWERVNGKSGEGKPETPPAAPEDNGPQEPPKGGGGTTTGRGGGKPSTPNGGRKPAEPKPAKPKPEGEGPKDSGGDDIDLGGLDELGGFEGLFAKRKPNESRRPSREGEIVNEARYIPEEATEEQNRAVEKVIDVLAGIGKQLLEKKGMRTQSELVDFMRQNKQIRDALDRIGFDEEDKSNLYNDMWGQRVSTPWEGERSRMRLSEYADELSKTDKPKQDDKPKQIVSPIAPTVKNVVYKPNSKGNTNESIIPASMAQAVKTALGKINGGDTDGFVMDKVGFKDKDELYGALNAEQIDGVALAISAIERGEGLILGDMTGIGKGRQLAAVIRYARKEGIRPVFVTEKPGLFKDMMRDLLDVGADTSNKPFRPLILASEGNGTVTLADGSTVNAADAKTIEKLLSGDLDKLAKGYDALFVTYANLNSVLPEAFVADQNAAVKEKTHNEKTETREPSELTRKKLNLVAKWARGSIVVMDEAHNAAGVDSTQAIQWREIIDTTSGVNAKGVVMASATYAKTPKNYVLYALRTPIKEAHLSNNELLMTFARGGVPLQEWLASQLTGESYIRRERDMTGVNFDYRICVDGYDAEHPEKSTPEALEKVKAIRKSNDQAAKIANIMLALDNKASEAFKKLKEVLSPGKGKKGGAISVLVQQADGTYKEEMVDARMYPEALKMSNSTFASKIAMINAQLFMAEKAESAADAAIKAIKNGELPMIVFENTFDSLMDDLPVDEKGVLESVDYAQAFVRYLEQLGNFTIKLPKKNANGAQEVLKCRIDLSGDPDFALAKRMIENEGVGLHVSPVDRIRERLEAAGYKVGELSGRKNSIQKLADGKYHRVKRKTEDPDKVTDDYNTGKIDVLLINASGSTGRSMHEKGTLGPNGEKIPGTTQSGEKMLMRPRHQIYVQNFNNETTMVQAMGRIDRTGQVEHGRYTFLMTPVPAETNILMRAQRKREQLKANTTAQQDRNSFDAVNASDFINKYGDEVVAEYLENNPKIANALQIPLKVVRDGTGRATSGLAKKATANAYTLTCDQQQEFYDDVQAAYDEYVKVLKENGDYDLETQVVDLQAETIADHMFVRGSHESDSMFSQDTNIARCRVKVQRKPMKVEEIEQHIAEVTGAEDKYEYEEKFQEKFDKHFADMEADVEKEFEAKEKNVDNDGKKNDKLGKIRAFKAEAQRLVKDFPLDLLMPFYADTSEVNDAQGRITTESMPHAIVYDVKLGRTLGSSTIVFAVNDGRQKVSVRMNDDATFRYLRRLQIMPAGDFNRSEWNKSQGDAYEDAFIITGNLIGAYHSPIASRGRMIRYTDSEGNLHTGILMPRNFKTKDVTIEKPISEFYNQFKQFARYRHSRKDELPVFAGGQLEVENTHYTNEFCFSAKGELAKRIDKDPELEIYRTGKTVSRYRVFEHNDNTIQKVLGILAGRYGVSASVPIDPAHFMTREERDAEAESRMFRVEENIEETQPSAYSPYSGMPYVVHVPKERRKNMDATSDWLDKTIEQMNNNGLYGRYEGKRTNESGKRVYSEFYFQNKAMAEEFVKMVNNEPVRPLAIDEKVEAKEPNWEEVDRSQHTYRLARPYEQLTGDDIAKTFGFRGVDTRSTNAEGVRDFYNAFMTMAMLLNIDPKSISLGGNMDVNMLNSDAADRVIGKDAVAAFMKRGKSNSYTGATQKGMIFREGGSVFPIAHEWLHALDNYFGAFGLKNEETGFYEQSRMASESADRNKPWTARPEMRAAWYDLIKTLTTSGYYGRLENENFFKGSNFTDSKMRPQYWGKRTEMLARAFEAYMRKKITDNEDNLGIVGGERMRDMLSDGSTSTSGEFDPTEKEQYYINNAFDRFFETIKEKRDPDTGRVIMYEQAKQGETRRESTMRETRNLNRVLAKTGLANSVTIDSERDFAEGVFASTGRPMRTLDGIVYGYTDSEGNIHLNAKYLNFETPIHEYGHLWSAWAKKNHGDLWQRGIELAKESDAFTKLKEESQKKGSVYNGMTDDQLADEVLADAIGKKGQSMYDPKDWTRTARVKHWLTQLWHRIGEALGFRKRMPNMAVGDMSFDDIIRTAAGEVLGGKRLKGAKGRGKVRFQAEQSDIESRLKKLYDVKRGGSGEKIGKDIGSANYVHRSALGELTDAKRALVEQAMQLLPEDAVWNAVKIAKDGKVTFQYSPDFDTADEPIVEYDYRLKNGKYEKVKNGQIWHHKWNWVTDDYDGFDVQASKERSEFWKRVVAEHNDEVAKAIADYKGISVSDIKRGITSYIGQPNVWDNVVQPILREYADDGARFQQVAEPVKQAISSADTSRNQTPAGMNLAPLQPGTTNFDLGGGRWEKATNELAERGITNVVFDPFNRDAEHNRRAFEIVKNGGFDTVTCNNVLNVIAEPEVRSNVILQAAKALKPGGIAYFTVHEGDGKGNSRVTRDGWQEFRKTATYVDEVKQHFGSVERKGKLIIAKDPITDGQADWFMDKEQKEHVRFQQAPANNPAGSQQGNNEQLHIAREYAQDRTRNTTKFMEEVVENSISLRHVLEDIARKSGKPIADYENVYLAENQSHGMMTTELITFRDRRVNPLNDALRKLAKHYGGEPTKNYVWARHGIERSIYVCFRERAYELAEKEAEAAARARGEEVTDKDINDAYNAMLDELYNATSGYSRRAYLESLETECANILSAHGDKKPFEVTDKAGLTALNDKRSLVDDSPIENAWEIVKEYENNAGAEGEADVEALFDRLNDISKSMLDYSRDKGMMDKDTVEKIRKMFRFYVPLQGFAEGTMAQDYFEYVDSNPMRAGRAVPNTPKMRGRGSESADPIATLVRNAEMTIAAARRNTVATHLYNLATSRDTDLFAPARAWEAYDAAEDTWVPSTPDFTGCETTKDMMDAIRLHDEQMRQQRELGLAREARRGFSNRLITAQGAPKGLKMSMRQRHEHAVPVRINGKENVIYVLSDPRIAQIVNGTDKGSVDKSNAPFFYQANKLKRIQSGLMTSYNIAFWFANGARDIQNAFLRQAIMNSGSAAARTATQGLKGDPLGVIPWEALTLYNKAVKGTLDESNKHERYFKEFFEHGGITGYAFADQVEVIQSRVKKLLEHPRRNPRRLMFAVGEMMEKAGGAFEIAPRFATYVASRDGGKSVMQSVADAKEATVNFDRRGARRTWLMRAAAAFYAFLNPGIQGMQNRLHMWRTQPTKTTLLHAAGFAMGYLWKGIAVACLASLGRKDDEYDTQLTDHDRRNNICIPVGDDDWVKIPIDMEDRVLFGLGDAVRNGLDFLPENRYIGGRGTDDYGEDEGWLDYAKLISAWFPIDVGSENNWVPTSLQPVYDVYINRKDWRGNAVDWRNDYNAQLPEYQRVNPYVTGKTWTNASKWWSEAGGGDEVTRADSEWNEINPQHMQYMFQSYLGGIGTTVGQVMSLVETIGSDEDDVKFNSFKFPIANRFWKGNLNEYTAGEGKKARIWTNWANEISRRDREYRKRGAGTENNTPSPEAQANYEENLRYLELAKEIEKLARKKSTAKSKATKEGRTLTSDETKELDNAFNEHISEFEEKFLELDGKRKVPKWRKHYDD